MFGKLRNLAAAAATAAPLLAGTSAFAAKPTVDQALKLSPVQDAIDFDTPAAADLEKCTIVGENAGKATGWIVRDPDGQLLRRFMDSNGDNKVDLWCYFKNGIEIYRDVDADYNGKADQYRWLGTAGTRWGLDKDEDGNIDSWKRISAEETTAEVVAAVRDKDADRFQRLLPTTAEIESLGLDSAREKQLAARVKQAAEGFASIAQKQKALDKSAKWVHFGGSQPGIIPAGADDVTKDILVYDNVSAVVELSGQHKQIGIGTLISVGETWRVVDLPTNLLENEIASAGGFFFNNPLTQAPEVAGVPGDMDEKLQKLIARLEEVDKQLLQASGEQQAKLNDDRADVIEALIEAAGESEERAVWIRQYADTVSAATQTGGFPDGVKRLRALAAKLDKNSSDREQVPYVEFRAMTADYALQMQQPSANFVQVQQQWLENLADFVKKYPGEDDAAEAHLQLGIAYEFAGQEKDAIASYGTIVSKFPDAVVAKKAAGAKRRLESVGQPLAFEGKTIDGKSLSLGSLRGNVVVLHYWATWCEPCKEDLKTLKEIQAKYAGKKFTPVGVSLDNAPGTLTEYLRANRISWPQLYEDGGLDSRLSNELGILSLPTMLLIDQSGRVVHRNLHISELENELKKLLR
ncbi:MAG: redoxin domain-containing protein [Planctomycetales bacterium]|nr:redoxin domain-containing protein [Planctomycetales bacterium]